MAGDGRGIINRVREIIPFFPSLYAYFVEDKLMILFLFIYFFFFKKTGIDI